MWMERGVRGEVVVEDDPGVRRVAQRIFERADFRVRVVTIRKRRSVLDQGGDRDSRSIVRAIVASVPVQDGVDVVHKLLHRKRLLQEAG